MMERRHEPPQSTRNTETSEEAEETINHTAQA